MTQNKLSRFKPIVFVLVILVALIPYQNCQRVMTGVTMEDLKSTDEGVNGQGDDTVDEEPTTTTTTRPNPNIPPVTTTTTTTTKPPVVTTTTTTRPTTTTTKPFVEEEIDEVAKACADAERNNSMLVQKQTVDFKNTKTESGKAKTEDQPICPGWTKNSNLVEDKVDSKYEQRKSLEVPAGATVCDIKLSVAQQKDANGNPVKFVYDDIFFLTLNDWILASNFHRVFTESMYPTRVPTHDFKVGTKNITVYKYDWAGIVAESQQGINSGHEFDYCMGALEGFSSCSWPVSEQSGIISFAFPKEVILALGTQRASDQQVLGFTITGDNERSRDCYHSGLKLDLDIKYIYR